MKKTLIIFLLLAVGITWITYSMLKLAKIHCTLCVNFNGRNQCSEALGPHEAAALEEAHRNACALLTSGVTEVVACNRVQPENIECRPSP